MRRRTLGLTLPICAAVVAAGAWLADAGPLNPPAGPVTSTGRFSPRTEIDALPYTIAQSGSYYLGRSLTGVAGSRGVIIEANDADIDLNGFELIGGSGTLDGIIVNGAYTGVTVHDGQVRDWEASGIELGAGTRHHIYNVIVENNQFGGLSAGPASVIRNVVACENQAGIITMENNKITNCVATDNTYDGIVVGPESHASDSVAAHNGLNGIVLTLSSVLIGSTADGNGEHGIMLESDCCVSNCTASHNGTGLITGSGFYLVGENNHLQGCVATENWGHGFEGNASYARNAVEACTASLNGVGGWGEGFFYLQKVVSCVANSNQGTGIFSLDGVCLNSSTWDNQFYGIEVSGGTVADCAANWNGTSGIRANRSVVEGNSVAYNLSDGIMVEDGCHVLQNNCVENVDDGIDAFGNGNNIEGNNCYNNGADAIDTSLGTANSILSNRARNNPGGYNLNFAADTWGPIFAGPGPVSTVPGDHFVNISY